MPAKVYYNGIEISGTPFVSRTFEPIDYGDRWGVAETITLNGTLTGLKGSQVEEASEGKTFAEIFKENFKELRVTEGTTEYLKIPSVKVDAIEFPSDKWAQNGFIKYSVKLKAYDIFNIDAVIEPSDSYSFNENEDGTVDVTHKISAKGIKSGDKSAFDRAVTFVEKSIGKTHPGVCDPFWMPNKTPVLLHRSEQINRLEGTYSVTENYKYQVDANNAYLKLDKISLNEGIGNEYNSVDYEAEYSTDPTHGISLLRTVVNAENFRNSVALQLNAHYNSSILLGNVYQISLNINEDPPSNKISIRGTYHTGIDVFEKLAKTGHLDFNINYSKDELNGVSNYSIDGNLVIPGGNLETKNYIINNWKTTNQDNLENLLLDLVLKSEIYRVYGNGLPINDVADSIKISHNQTKATLAVNATYNDGDFLSSFSSVTEEGTSFGKFWKQIDDRSTFGEAGTGKRPISIWTSISSSKSGEKIAVTGIYMSSSILFVSVDSGKTWVRKAIPPISPAVSLSVKFSGDGNKLIIAGINHSLGKIHAYVSSDLGASYTLLFLKDTRGGGSPRISSSEDGSKIAVSTLGNDLLISNNSSLIPENQENKRNWAAITSSDSGEKLAAVVYGGQIYTSEDSGATWTARENNRNWTTIASSASGERLIAAERGGKIYISTNSGETWSARESDREWISVDCNDDGTKFVAAVFGGQIFVGTTSAVNSAPGDFWEPRATNGFWMEISMNGNASQIVVIPAQGYINISYVPSQTVNLSRLVKSSKWEISTDASKDTYKTKSSANVFGVFALQNLNCKSKSRTTTSIESVPLYGNIDAAESANEMLFSKIHSKYITTPYATVESSQGGNWLIPDLKKYSQVDLHDENYNQNSIYKNTSIAFSYNTIPFVRKPGQLFGW